MRVLWFSNTPASGIEYLKQTLEGTGGWMQSLDLQVQEEVELSIAFLYPYKIQSFKYKKTMYYPINPGNIILENFKKKWFHQVYDNELLPYYLAVIETVKPDIIHIHGTENSFSCIIDKTNIPIVISIQGNTTVYYHKFNSGLQGHFIKKADNVFNLKTLLFGRTTFRRSFITLGKMSLIEQHNLEHTKYIIGRTDWDRRITRVLASKSKYFVGNEILRDSFYENIWENKTIYNKIIIHTTNGNCYYKGFETLCYTLSLLNGLGFEVEWRVAGIAEDSLINKIVRKELKNNYPKKGLILLGAINERELVVKLQEAHIYVMPSHIENSPNNLCEAMLLGMPCIATFVGGTGSILKDGEEGILVQEGDPWAMAGAIIEFINNWSSALKFGEKAREKALKRHNKKTIVNDLLVIYKSITNEII